MYYDRTREQQEALDFLAQSTSSTENNDANSMAAPESAAVPSDHKRVKYAPAGTSLPHGSVGALMAHQAIAHGNALKMADAIFKYTAPEEVRFGSQSFTPSQFRKSILHCKL
jgi:hypothetical protein